MAGYNRIIIIGNLTRDPELKAVGTQASVCKLNIASNRQYKNRQNGSIAQEVCFIDVEVWGAQADTCKMYLQKGRPILVEGRLKLDSWKDNEGNIKSKHSIVSDKIIFLGSSSEQNAEENISEEPLQNTNQNTPLVRAASMDDGKKNYQKTQKDQFLKKESKEKTFTNNPPFAEDDLPF
jgi:single-strand DNA-binding protein